MTDEQPEQPVGPDPGRRALSTKGYVAAAVIPLLVAAGLFGLVVWNYDDSDILQGTKTPILVSSFLDGQPAGGQSIAGVLEQDDAGCPVLLTADGERVTPAWPAGWSARVSPGGTLTVYDPQDEPVVRTDQEVRATGSVVDVATTPYAGKPCAPASGQIAEVQSEVLVVGG